jgi:hypothetical protein
MFVKIPEEAERFYASIRPIYTLFSKVCGKLPHIHNVPFTH